MSTLSYCQGTSRQLELLSYSLRCAVDGVVIYLTDYQRSITERLAKASTGQLAVRSLLQLLWCSKVAAVEARAHAIACMAGVQEPLRSSNPSQHLILHNGPTAPHILTQFCRHHPACL